MRFHFLGVTSNTVNFSCFIPVRAYKFKGKGVYSNHCYSLDALFGIIYPLSLPNILKIIKPIKQTTPAAIYIT